MGGPLEWVFAVFMAAVGIGLFLPRGIFLFNPSGYRIHFDDSPYSSMKTFHKKTVSEIADKITALGFTELGVKVEKFPLWGSRTEELCLASPAAQAFAVITVFKNTATYHFFTPFSGGQVIMTSPGSFKKIETPEFLSSIVRDAEDAGVVLAKHQENVAAFVSKGLTPYREFTRESRLESTALYYNSGPLRSKARKVGAFTFFAFVILMVPLVLQLLNVSGLL
jgi:hypothetical protein